MGYGISPASLRLDDLTPSHRLACCEQSGERSITIAPETGSGSAAPRHQQDRHERARSSTAPSLIFRSGIENLKLYYMIGLPTETDEDLVAIRDLTLEIRAHHARRRARRAARIGRIVASVNPLIPKPGTTYQWLPMTRRRASSSARSSGCARSSSGIDNVYFNIKSERHSYYQGLLSLGDRRVADVIELAEAQRRQLARRRRRDRPRRRRLPLPRPQPDPFLPWQIIDGGLKTGFFRAELDKSLRAEWTMPPKRVRRTRAHPVSGLASTHRSK